jgi:serine/threonine-protein kinase
LGDDARFAFVGAEGTRALVQGIDPQRAAGVREGDVLAGKYRVERVLGMGGMGVVVAARHLQLDAKVAIKFLLPTMLEDRDAVARFAREARAAVKITSEHVARVFDVGTLETGAPYMVMEYLEGGDLAAWVKQRGALSVEQAVEFVLQACVAVAEAHALGIVHRDLKPANLFSVRRLDGQLSIKVLDFGISKLAERAGTGSAMAMTRTAALMGSPVYMSPEQLRSARDVDAQTDIWALGVILFELVTGRAPFLADSITELAIKINNEPAPAVRTLRPDVPGALEAVIFTCLEKDRLRRYRNVAELALALLPLAPMRAKGSVERISGIIQAAGLSASAPGVPPSPPTPSTLLAPGTSTLPAPVTVAPVGRTTRGSTGHKTAIGVAAAGAVALVAVAGSVALLGRGPQRSEDAQAAGMQTAGPVESAKPLVTSAPSTAERPPTRLSEAQSGGSPTADPPAASAAASTNTPPAPARSAISRPAPSRTASGTPAPGRSSGAPSVAPPATPATGRPNCSPPYVIDSAGDRQYKPECL